MRRSACNCEFTHFCTRSRKWGSFVIGRKTIKKRMRAKLKAIKVELRKAMHDPIAKTGTWVKQMLQGRLNYYAVSGNHPSLWWFCNQVGWLWLKSLRRRSQKARSLGSASSASLPASFRQSRCYIRCLFTASTPKPEGGARCVSSARRDLCDVGPLQELLKQTCGDRAGRTVSLVRTGSRASRFPCEGCGAAGLKSPPDFATGLRATSSLN